MLCYAKVQVLCCCSRGGDGPRGVADRAMRGVMEAGRRGGAPAAAGGVDGDRWGISGGRGAPLLMVVLACVGVPGEVAALVLVSTASLMTSLPLLRCSCCAWLDVV